MIHLNGNRMCVIDCETTGLDHTKYDIWQICIIPLTFDLKRDETIIPFEILMQPRFTENREKGAVSKAQFNRANLNGLSYESAALLFTEWYERLDLGFMKRIVPLAHNWPFDRDFIREWLGPAGFDYHFDPRYRDTLSLAATINDVCDFRAERYPFPNLKLRSLATSLGMEWDSAGAHDALYDSAKTAEVYRKLVKTLEFISE